MKKSEEYAERLRRTRKVQADLTQAEAESYLKSKGLRVSARSLSKWENGGGPPEQVDGEEVVRLLRQYKKDRTVTANDGDPIYDTEASAGDGSLAISETPEGQMPASQSMSAPGREIYWVRVVGDSMAGTLQKNTLIPILKLDDPVLRQDDIYLFRLEDAVQVKRLQRIEGNRLLVISDNPAYEDRTLSLDDGYDFEILGRVLV